MIKIAFFKAIYGNAVDRFVSFFTLSKYSHCEIVFSDGLSASASSADGGIRFKHITFDEKWDLYELNIPYANEQYIKDWFEYNKNDGYDYIGAGGSIFKLDFSSEDKKYCSYSCSLVLGLTPVNSPAALYKKLSKLGFINSINKEK